MPTSIYSIPTNSHYNSGSFKLLIDFTGRHNNLLQQTVHQFNHTEVPSAHDHLINYLLIYSLFLLLTDKFYYDNHGNIELFD